MVKANNANAAAQCLQRIPKAIGELKGIAKRVTPENEVWPEELRKAIQFLRSLEDELDQQFPANIR